MDNGITGKILPQAIEAEQCVIGSILLEPVVYDEVMEIVSSEEFYREDHKEIISAIEELHKKESTIDLITTANILKARGTLDRVGGIPYMSDIMSKIPTTANVKHYAGIVHEKFILRSFIKTASDISNICYEESEPVENIVQIAETQILKVNESKESTMCHASDVLQKAIIDLEERYHRKGQLNGLYTGFTDLDFKLGGLQKGDLILIAARPSMGKTALAENIAIFNSCFKKVPTAFFSMEMDKEKIMNRIIAELALVDNSKMRLGNMEDGDWQKIARVLGIISESKFEIDDTPHLKPSQISSKCRRLKKKYGELGLIVIDHLTELWRPMKSNRDSSEHEENVRSMKRLAREMNCPVILLQQLSRSVEGRSDKRPILSDLRETGVSEEVADVIMMIYRDDYYNPDTEKNNIAEIIINKGRDCGTGTVELVWLPQYTKFANLEKFRK